jgi:hypothetical protein
MVLACNISCSTDTLTCTLMLALLCLWLRLFARIPGLERNKLVDVLCSSAHDVTTSAISLLASGECHSGTSALVQHCNALQQYAFLLRWLTAQADAGSNKDEREQRAATADHGKYNTTAAGRCTSLCCMHPCTARA